VGKELVQHNMVAEVAKDQLAVFASNMGRSQELQIQWPTLSKSIITTLLGNQLHLECSAMVQMAI
jgi:hypothetical protein